LRQHFFVKVKEDAETGLTVVSLIFDASVSISADVVVFEVYLLAPSVLVTDVSPEFVSVSVVDMISLLKTVFRRKQMEKLSHEQF